MSDEGKYIVLWKKYMPVIKLLLKKTGDQKLQLYRHEFEVTGAKNKTGYSFSIEIVNGKVINKISGVAIAKDLIQSMNETPGLNEWLKGQTLKISLGRNYEMKFTKQAPPVVDAAPSENGTQQNTIQEESHPQNGVAEA